MKSKFENQVVNKSIHENHLSEIIINIKRYYFCRNFNDLKKKILFKSNKSDFLKKNHDFFPTHFDSCSVSDFVLF